MNKTSLISEIPINEILKRVLKISEKEFYQAQCTSSVLSSRTKMIAVLLKTQIRISRFLVLYRFYKFFLKSSNVNSNQENVNNRITYSVKSLKTIYLNILKTYQTNQNSIMEYRFIDFLPSKRHICNNLFILSLDTPKNIYYYKNKVFVYSKNFSYCLKVNSKGKIIIKKLQIKISKCISESNIKKLVQCLLKKLEGEKNIFKTIEKTLNKYYYSGIFIDYSNEIRKYSSYYKFGCYYFSRDFYIEFPIAFSPYNLFRLSLQKYKIYFSSCFLGSESILYQVEVTDLKQIEFILSNAKKKIYEQKCKHIYHNLINGIIALNDKRIKYLLQRNEFILIFNKWIIFKVQIDGSNGDIIIENYTSIFTKRQIYSLLITEEKHIHIYLKSFIELFIFWKIFNQNSIILNNFTDIILSHFFVFKFSFADDFGVLIYGSNKLIILNQNNKNIPRKININANLGDIFFDIKKKIICSMIMNLLNKNGILYSHDKNKIFIHLPKFDRIILKINKYNSWYLIFKSSFHVNNNMFNIEIFGKNISCRFSSWILYIVHRILIYLQIVNQIVNYGKNYKIVKKIHFQNLLNFQCRFYLEICHYLDYKMEPFTFLRTLENDLEVFYAICNNYSCDFDDLIQKIKPKIIIQTLPISDHLFNMFHPCLLTLRDFYKIFQRDGFNSKWIVIKPTANEQLTESIVFASINLIYDRKYSFVVSLLHTHVFRIAFVNVKTAAVALSSYPKFTINSELRCNLQIDKGELSNVKAQIEKCFAFHKILKTLGFKQKPISRMNGPNSFPKFMSYISPSDIQELYINVSMSIEGISVLPTEQTPKLWRNAFITQLFGKQRHLYNIFILSLLRLGNTGYELISILNDSSIDSQLINWSKTVEEGCSVTINALGQKQILMNLVTRVGNYYIEISVDNSITTVTGEHGVVSSVNTISNLKHWLQTLEGEQTFDDDLSFGFSSLDTF